MIALDNLYAALTGSSAVSTMVDAKIYKFKQPHEMEKDLKSAAHHSLISCEVADIAGPKTATDPIFVVHIYSRQGADRGAAYCSDIAEAVKSALQNGWSGVSVESMGGKVSWNSETVGHQFKMEIRGHIKTTYTISLTASPSSPQQEDEEVVFVATVSPSEAVQYRFLLYGPGTGSAWRDMTGWQARNSFSWKPGSKDVGASSVKVQVRAGPQSSSQIDQESSAVPFTITAKPGGGGGAGSPPTITSLTPNLASPQPAETEIDFICIASDPDNDNIYYRFFLTGPGTASKKKMVADWTHRNYWTWIPESADVGNSTIEVQIRDGLHAAEGSYDANASVSYTVTAGSGGTGSTPTITSLTPSLSSPRGQGTQIDFICIASDPDNDNIYYRFFLTGPGTASKKKLVADWSHKNSWTWTPESADVGNSTIEVQIRDGLHAKEGSYDANTSVSYTISSNSAPTISSVYVNEYGNPFVGEEIVVVCEASDTNGDQIYYKFFIYRESVGAAREELTGWQTENSVKVKLDKTDYGGISVYAQVRDKYHAGEGGYDAEDSVFIDVQRAEISSVTFSLASPKAHETTIEVVCTANKSSGLFYRFWLKGPGTGNVWKDMTGWTEKNSWSWRTLACDIGVNTIRAEVTDTKADWSDSDTTGRRIDSSYTIS